MCADTLAHVVDDEDGDGMAALHLADKSEEGRDVRAAVFVQTVQSHQGVEQQELRAQTRERCVESLLIGLEIESDRVGCDDVEIEGVEVELAVGAEGAEALAYARKGVLGEVDEGGASLVDGEAIEARGTGRDADGEVESKPALCRFRLSSAEADGLVSPDVLHEPVRAGLEGGQLEGAHDG